MRTPMSLASFSLEQPMSMNILSRVTTLARSSGGRMCGGFAAMTPITRPLGVRMRTFWPRSTWSNHPPMRVEGEKSMGVDAAHDEADLVDVAGEENDGMRRFSPCAEVEGAQLVAFDLVGKGLDIGLHHRDRVPLETGWAEALR